LRAQASGIGRLMRNEINSWSRYACVLDFSLFWCRKMNGYHVDGWDSSSLPTCFV